MAKKTFDLVQLKDVELDLKVGLVDGLLDKVGISEIFGPSGSGKTFLAIDLAGRVAAGMVWNELEVERGPVVYLAAENPVSVKHRFWAWARQHSKGDVPLYILVSPLCLSGKEGHERTSDAIALAQQLKESNIEPRLIVIDTLARSMQDDENSTEAMSAYVRACELLRDAFDCHVLIVHHTGKDASRGARGSYALKAAIDTEIEVWKERGQSQGAFTITKARDGELEGKEYGFELTKVELGKNDKGRLVTTRVAVPGEVPERSAKGDKLSMNEEMAKMAFEEIAKKGRAPFAEWREACERMFTTKRPDVSFRRSAHGLHKKGVVMNDGENAMNFVTWEQR